MRYICQGIIFLTDGVTMWYQVTDGQLRPIILAKFTTRIVRLAPESVFVDILDSCGYNIINIDWDASSESLIVYKYHVMPNYGRFEFSA